MKYVLLVLSVFILLGCEHGDMMEEEMATEEAMGTTVVHKTLYYGDIVSDKVVMLDIESMQLRDSIESNGHYPYEVSEGFGSDLFVINRKDYTMGILDTQSNTIVDEVALDFSPRSIKINNYDAFLTSSNAPSGAIINGSTASAAYSDSSYVEPSSYGGSNATGHPVWVDDNYFLLLDRTENSIELYVKGNHLPIDKFETKSSVHHVMLKNGYFYGVEEGKQGVVSPGILKFSVVNEKINIVQERLLSELGGLPSDFVPATWGAHHAAFHPTLEYIYMGSSEGNVFVMDLATLSLKDTFKSGKGVGHITFHNTMLITTNHYDTFKSFYDASNPENNVLIKDIYFDTKVYADVTMQSHTTHIVDNMMYFMFNTDHDSTLYEIDLNRLTIHRKLTLDNHTCLMGSFVESEDAM